MNFSSAKAVSYRVPCKSYATQILSMLMWRRRGALAPLSTVVALALLTGLGVRGGLASDAPAQPPSADEASEQPPVNGGVHRPAGAASAKLPSGVAVLSGDISAADWAATLERIAGSVVAIELDQARSFDTERNMSAQATGFVVDAERGLILTNRHVVTPGPVTAQATFLNREEVQLYPVYRDPVHDFGFYRYDPSKLQFISPKALPLAPQAAQIGREIRVVGNNAGEQLSILAGTLARLDREAPEYGIGRYNDFNTFYIQAASGTSGGSSGSPVIDIQGRVVALNAGGATGAASSFYLPLGRVQRALPLIQQGKPVTRGTLQTEFRYRPYDELRRLGLPATPRRRCAAPQPDGTGMLVVTDVQPGSASDGLLEPGDVLVRVNGTLVTQFEPLEAVLDDSVGAQRRADARSAAASSTPRASRSTISMRSRRPPTWSSAMRVVHTLSYQEARAFHRPIRGVFVAASGYMFDAAGVPRGAVITAVNSKPVNDAGGFRGRDREPGRWRASRRALRHHR